VSGWWNTDTYTDGHSNGHGYSYINAPTDAYAEVCANPKTSSHTSAKTVRVIFNQRLSRSATGQMTKK